MKVEELPYYRAMVELRAKLGLAYNMMDSIWNEMDLDVWKGREEEYHMLHDKVMNCQEEIYALFDKVDSGIADSEDELI